MTRAVQLSAKSVEHYGPWFLGDMVRDVFGGPIHLDPASSTQANLLIGAERIYTEADNGLTRTWFGNVYLNPPGGRVKYGKKKVNSAALWYATLAHRFTAGLLTQAVFMVFNLELFRYAQGFQVRQPASFPLCYPKTRIDFWKPGPDGFPVEQGSPGHPNALIYMGPHADRFKSVFSAPRPGTDWQGGEIVERE